MKGTVKAMKKAILWLILIPIVFCAATVDASEPYVNYTYSYKGKAQLEPQAYYPYRILAGKDLDISEFATPGDIFQDSRGDVYIVDSGNNRIIHLNSDLKLKREIKNFMNGSIMDSFLNPQGIFVQESGEMYIADTDHSRIVVLNANGELIRIIQKPVSELISDNFEYRPIKISVDYANRIFIVARNINDGIIELDSQGAFVGFFGAVKVSRTIVDAFWKMIATAEQRKRMSLSVPTEYSSIDVDMDGFIYGTVSAIDDKNLDPGMFIHKLNPMGNDVLKRDGTFAPMGDVDFAVDSKMIPETSKLVDITIRNNGIYSVLDQRMGRIFTYDQYGNLLYVFGSNGDSMGQFGMCSAITSFGTDEYLVLDAKYNQIVVFKPTNYGRLITSAVELYAKRSYEESEKIWEQVLKYTAKSEIAFSGMGMNLMRNKKYSESMEYYRLANDRGLYSEAFKFYRLQWINQRFTVISILCIGFLLFIWGYTLVKKYHRKRRSEV
jgi:hypothetical protein